MELKREIRKGQLVEICFGIVAGILGMILSPWRARLLSHVEGWEGPTLNLYWLLVILGPTSVPDLKMIRALSPSLWLRRMHPGHARHHDPDYRR